MFRMVRALQVPVVFYNYSTELSSMLVSQLNTQTHLNIAGGFFACELSQAAADILLQNDQVDHDLVKNWTGKPVIWADLEMVRDAKLSEEEFLAALLHEEGHIVHRHMFSDSVEKTVCAASGSSLISDAYAEMQADAHACLTVDRKVMKNALRKCLLTQVRRICGQRGFLSVTWNTFKALMHPHTLQRMKNLGPKGI